MAEGLGKLFGEVHKPAALQRAVTEAKERERRFAQEKQKLLEQKKELTLLKKVQEKQAKALGKKKNGNINYTRLHYRDIQEAFARGDDISNLIRDTLLSHGAMPDNVPVTLLQNTNPETTCYMNSVLQCVASLPGFVGAETWPLKDFNENDPYEVKGAAAVEALQALLAAMRAGPAARGPPQEALITRQAIFYTCMYEYTKERHEALGRADDGERLWPLMQSDADTFRTLLFEVLTSRIKGFKKGTKTRGEPAGHFMLRPLFGFFRVITAMPVGAIGPALAENRTMESLIEVAVPPISPPTNENNKCGLNAFINDLNETKIFRHLPDTLILRAGIFGFEGKYADPIPIVPEFDMQTYHQPNWEPINAGSTVYRLHAIVCHHGETIAAGHYTALVLRDGMWFHINDAPPSATYIEVLPAMLPAHVETLENANPYIFFYVRDGTGPYVVAQDGTSVGGGPAGGGVGPAGGGGVGPAGGGGAGGGGGGAAATGGAATAATGGPSPTGAAVAARSPAARGPAAPTVAAAPTGAGVINAGGGWSRLATPSTAGGRAVAAGLAAALSGAPVQQPQPPPQTQRNRDATAAGALLVAAQAANPTVPVRSPQTKNKKERKRGRKTRKRSKH